MIKEFREFIQRGNVLDLAIGVVIAAAFGVIIKAFIAELLNPAIGLFFNADLTSLMYVVSGTVYETVAAAREAGEVVFGYGIVITTVIEFILTAFVLFLIVKAYNAMKREEEDAPAEPAAPPAEQLLLEEIRDLLRDR